jgi:hypothetical protein
VKYDAKLLAEALLSNPRIITKEEYDNYWFNVLGWFSIGLAKNHCLTCLSAGNLNLKRIKPIKRQICNVREFEMVEVVWIPVSRVLETH